MPATAEEADADELGEWQHWGAGMKPPQPAPPTPPPPSRLVPPPPLSRPVPLPRLPASCSDKGTDTGRKVRGGAAASAAVATAAATAGRPGPHDWCRAMRRRSPVPCARHAPRTSPESARCRLASDDTRCVGALSPPTAGVPVGGVSNSVRRAPPPPPPARLEPRLTRPRRRRTTPPSSPICDAKDDSDAPRSTAAGEDGLPSPLLSCSSLRPSPWPPPPLPPPIPPPLPGDIGDTECTAVGSDATGRATGSTAAGRIGVGRMRPPLPPPMSGRERGEAGARLADHNGRRGSSSSVEAGGVTAAEEAGAGAATSPSPSPSPSPGPPPPPPPPPATDRRSTSRPGMEKQEWREPEEPVVDSCREELLLVAPLIDRGPMMGANRREADGGGGVHAQPPSPRWPPSPKPPTPLPPPPRPPPLPPPPPPHPPSDEPKWEGGPRGDTADAAPDQVVEHEVTPPPSPSPTPSPSTGEKGEAAGGGKAPVPPRGASRGGEGASFSDGDAIAAAPTAARLSRKGQEPGVDARLSAVPSTAPPRPPTLRHKERAAACAPPTTPRQTSPKARRR